MYKLSSRDRDDIAAAQSDLNYGAPVRSYVVQRLLSLIEKLTDEAFTPDPWIEKIGSKGTINVAMLFRNKATILGGFTVKYGDLHVKDISHDNISGMYALYVLSDNENAVGTHGLTGDTVLTFEKIVASPVTVTPIGDGERVQIDGTSFTLPASAATPDFLAEIAVQPKRKPLRLTAGNSRVLAKIKHDYNKTIYKWCLKAANVRGLEADAISKLLVYVRISHRSQVAAEYEALIKHASEGPQDAQSGDTGATTAVD